MTSFTTGLFTTCVLVCSFLLLCTAAAHDTAAVVLHTSLVDLLNADQSQWSLSLSSSSAAADTERNADAEASAAAWTAMREVWVEGQQTESAGALLFALPPPTTSYYRIGAVEEDAEGGEEDAEEGEVEGSSVIARAQRRHIFGHPSLAFHGLSCEEYADVGGQQRRSGGVSGGAGVRGRCYFMRDSGEDFFFNYRVEAPRINGAEGETKTEEEEGREATASRNTAPRRRRARAGGEEASARADPARTSRASTPRVPQTFSHASEGGLWSEFVVLPGAESGVVGEEGDVHVGHVSVSEDLTKSFDAADSTRVQLVFTVAVADTNLAASTATSGAAVTLHMRLKGETGAFCEAAAREAIMARKASQTSFFNRWVFPVVYVGCIYGLVYGAVWMQAKRKASAAAAAATEGLVGDAAGPSPAAGGVQKKQQ